MKTKKTVSNDLNILLDHLPVSIYCKDTNGVYLACNQYTVNISGFTSPGDVIGKTDYDMPWCDQADALRAIDQSVMSSGQSNTSEEIRKLGDGTSATYLTIKKPLCDNKGKIIGVCGLSIDIKHRQIQSKPMEETQKQHNDIFSSLDQIMACLPGSVYWKDKNGIYLGCNDELAKLIGVPKTMLIGVTDYDIVKKLNLQSEMAESIVKIDQAIMKSGIPRLNYEEVPFHFADGKTINQLSNKVPLRDKKGDVIGIVGISIDITERKKMEEDLRKTKKELEIANKSKTEFLANMTHDIKTPLATLVGLSQILTHKLTGENLEFAKSSLATSQELLKFFNSCVELSKLEHEEVAVTSKIFSLKAIFDEMVDLLGASAKEKNIKFIVRFDQKIPASLLGNRTYIYRILLNLIGNAIKFTSKGAITLNAKLIEISRNQEAIVKLTVADTGIGIPKNKQNKIFERFTRFSSSHEGHGIGLYTVEKFVNTLQGTIQVNSEEGKGSEFIITLPLKIPSVITQEEEALSL